MKGILLPVFVLVLFACKSKNQKSAIAKAEKATNNQELLQIYESDQADRKSDSIDWTSVSKRDSLRKLRVYELLDSNMVRTSEDYHHAAMIFQHGGDSTSFGMAVQLMRKCIELDSTTSKWLLAAAIDRYLLSCKKPQIYGTQFIKRGNGPWERMNMDTTLISDEERIEYGVETLAEQREKLNRMNRK